MPSVNERASGTKRPRATGDDASRLSDQEETRSPYDAFKRSRVYEPPQPSQETIKHNLSSYFTRDYDPEDQLHSKPDLAQHREEEEAARALLSWHQLPQRKFDINGEPWGVRHPRWWHEDGDVIISVARTVDDAAHRVLLKLHVAVLSRHLEPFHDMFEFASAGPDEETLDGVPVVTLHGPETAVHWALISVLLYNSREFGRMPVLYEDIAALLNFSVKFTCIRFREAAVSILSTICPTKLSNWKHRKENALMVGGPLYTDVYVLTDLLLKYQIPELLPAARLAIVRHYSIRQLFEGWPKPDGTRHYLPREELQRIMHGRERLLVSRRGIIFRMLRPHEIRNGDYYAPGRGRCKAAMTARGNACSVFLESWSRDWEAHADTVYTLPHALAALTTAQRTRMRRMLCEQCWRTLKARILVGQRRVWRMLPGMFGMGDWFEIEKRGQAVREGFFEWSIAQEQKCERQLVKYRRQLRPLGDPGYFEDLWWNDTGASEEDQDIAAWSSDDGLAS